MLHLTEFLINSYLSVYLFTIAYPIAQIILPEFRFRRSAFGSTKTEVSFRSFLLPRLKILNGSLEIRRNRREGKETAFMQLYRRWKGDPDLAEAWQPTRFAFLWTPGDLVSLVQSYMLSHSSLATTEGNIHISDPFTNCWYNAIICNLCDGSSRKRNRTELSEVC